MKIKYKALATTGVKAEQTLVTVVEPEEDDKNQVFDDDTITHRS